jgi:hypothetical protein
MDADRLGVVQLQPDGKSDRINGINRIAPPIQ